MHYLDEAAGVVVMDFIEQHPLYDYQGISLVWHTAWGSSEASADRAGFPPFC
jgi:hypothetical protein